ncbi:MAG: tRNA preQ1(34) S-adenosylmethionine ribosyltransferase-isomerase QueA [Cyanobacteria bacterium J06628_6]
MRTSIKYVPSQPETLPTELPTERSSESAKDESPTVEPQSGAAQPEAHQTGVDHSLKGYHYTLPPDLIAQQPAVPRDSARLLVVDSPVNHRHSHFRDLGEFLQPGDLLVFNNTQVIPARLYGQKPTGAKVEVFLLEPRGACQWLALVRPGKRIRPGSHLYFGDPVEPQLMATVDAIDAPTGGRWLTFALMPGAISANPDLTLNEVMTALGQIPLPPYITEPQATPEQYQTIYASQPGAVAAPTAGLHFTAGVFQRLAERGIETAQVTLHVGIGTFRPVESADITDHVMHAERAELPQTTVEQIQQTKARGGRVIAVGTTTVRTLEGVATQTGQLTAFTGAVNLFIYPGYQWKVVDGLITNFHLPGSSLLMLVSGLIGRERLMALYQAAIEARYRFYSFGDAMLILPAATSAQGTPSTD